MKVKTRIFLWILALFIPAWISFFCAIYYEMKQDLFVVRHNLQARVTAMNNQRQQQIEQYLRITLGAAKAEIATILDEVGTHEKFLHRFDPSEENFRTRTWLSGSLLMATAESIDFVQCLNAGEVTALIISTAPYVDEMLKITLPNGLNIVAHQLLDGSYRVYIGVPYWVTIDQRAFRLPGLKLPWPDNNDFWLLFSPQALLDADYQSLLQKPLTLTAKDAGAEAAFADPEFFQKIIKDSLQTLIHAQQILREDPELSELLTSSKLKDWVRAKVVAAAEQNVTLDKPENFEEELIIQLKNHSEAKYLIWALATLVGSGLWDFDPHNSMAPRGILRSPHAGQESLQIGTGVLAEDVFFTKPFPTPYPCAPQLADVETYCVDGQLSVIQSSGLGNHLFLGDTMHMMIPDSVPRLGSLTVAVNGDEILRRAALILQESVFFVSGEEVLKAYGSEGQEIPADLWQSIDLVKLGSEGRGVTSDGEGNEYFFTKLTTNSNDPYLFIFRLKGNEYFPLQEIDVKSKLFLRHLSLEIAVITVIFLLLIMLILDRILTRVTKPIVDLAAATAQICEGHLSKVSLPDKDKMAQDEVGELYHSFGQMVDSMIEGEKAKGLLSKVVSSKIAHKIMSTGVHLGGEKREVTVLFSDIREFTSLSEQIPPEELIELLNSYLARMSDFIELYDGVVDKYVGDEIMALFGAPLDVENAPGQAVLCAIDMIEDLKKWNEERKGQGLRVLEVGTGINTGMVVAGNIGGGGRANYTVIGQVVNIAERLCSVARGMEIIVCKATLEQMRNKEEVLYEEQAPLELKGVSRVVSNYRIFGRSKPSKSRPLN